MATERIRSARPQPGESNARPLDNPDRPSLTDVEQYICTVLGGAPYEDDAPPLPPGADADPGAFLFMILNAWYDAGPRHGDEAHTAQGLKTWLKGSRISGSLQHYLKARYAFSLKDEEARELSRKEIAELLTALLTHWSVREDGEHQVPLTFPFSMCPGGAKLTPQQAAERITRVLCGPIYGFYSQEIRIAPSPGINTARFLSEHASATAIVFPVHDHPMHGADDPVARLDGVRISLEHCLGRGDARLIWLIENPALRTIHDYVRYLFERSLLCTLFQLLKAAATNRWGRFAAIEADALMERLFVCVYVGPNLDRHRQAGAARDLGLEDFLPRKEPERWKNELPEFSFTKYGFVVVAKDGDGEGLNLEYWSHTKPAKRLPAAFRPIQCGAPQQMIAAHQVVIRAVEQAAIGEPGPALKYMRQMGWHVLAAPKFIQGVDLKDEHPTKTEA
jgi:hypothetical protein